MSALRLSELRRLVLKIGSSLLVDDHGRFRSQSVVQLANDVARLRADGHQVLVVSSGAVAIGCHVLSIQRRRARLDELQAAAAAGQVQLVEAWRQALSAHAIDAAQILLTPGDTEHRRRFLNAKGTLETLMDHDVVPIINENDTVATDELRYGDNDRLAARVAQMVMADGLVLLSDVDGLYTADPSIDSLAVHVPVVDDIDAEVLAMAGASRSHVGSGGMATKLRAAQIATHAGCATIIAPGRGDAPMRELSAGGRCTVCLPAGNPKAARKQWLAGVLSVHGELHLDSGAALALNNGGSLLPVGVASCTGEFRRGDAVSLVSQEGAEIGRGLTAYAADEVRAIIGVHSDDIATHLGYRGRPEVVHRNDLVLFDTRRQD